MKISFFKLSYKVLLILLLTGQIYLILNTLSNRGLNVSTLLDQSQFINNLPENIALDYDRALFCLPFKVRILNPKITLTDGGIHKFKFNYIDLSWHFFNKNPIDLNHWKIIAKEGSVYSEYYPDTIDNVTLIAYIRNNALDLAQLNGSSNDKAFSLSFKSSDQTQIEYRPFSKANFATVIQPLAKTLKESKNSHLSLDLKTSQSHPLQLTVVLTTDHLQFRGIELSNAYIAGDVFQNTANLYLHTEVANYNEHRLILNNSEASIAIRNNSIETLYFDTESLNINEYSVENSYGFLDLSASDTIVCDAYFTFQGTPSKLVADYPLQESPIQAHIHSYIDPNAIQLPTLKFISYPNFQEANIRSQFKVLLNKDFNIQRAKGHLSAERILSIPIDLKAFYTQIDYAPNTSLNSVLYARSDKGPLNLRSSIDLETHDYHFGLKGFTNPKDFNAILPEWWTRLFQNFSYNPISQSHGNFTLYGNFKNPIPDHLFGTVQASNIEYKGVYITDADLTIRNSQLFTDIQLHHAETATGSASGTVQLTVKRDGFPLPESVRLDLESQLELKDSRALFGKNIQTIIDSFETDDTPKISLKAAIFNAHYPQHKDKSYYELFIFTDQPLKFVHRPLDYLYAEVYGRKGEHYIRNAEAGLADGQLAFLADITDTRSSEPQIRLIADLKNSQSEKAIDTLFLREARDTNARENAQSLDLTLNSKGALLDIHKHSGEGTLSIKGDNLGKIHLLGPFSKALDELKIPIGSFGLNALESHFAINNETVLVDTLHINGDQTHIFGDGVYNLKDNAIDFTLKIDLLKNAKLSFSLLGALGDFINPVTKLLSFKVTGTPQKQIWRSRFDPRNLFD